MAITVNDTYPATYDSADVYDDQGYGRVINFEEEDSVGNTSPLDLTSYTPITYSVQKSDDLEVFSKTIPDGQTSSGDGLVIQGASNEQLSLSIADADTKDIGARLYRHELKFTRDDGTPLYIFIGNLPIKNLFS